MEVSPRARMRHAEPAAGRRSETDGLAILMFVVVADAGFFIQTTQGVGVKPRWNV